MCCWDFGVCVVGGLVVISEVSSTYVSPSLCVMRFVGLLMMKLVYFLETDNKMASSIMVQIQGADPLPCPAPRILYNTFV